MVEVRRDGAFSVNSVGLTRDPFPLSFSVREHTGCWVVQATAAQAAELADILSDAAKDTVVVLDVETNSFLDEQYVQWKPSRIAAAQGVDCSTFDLGELAAGVVGLDEEVLVMRADDVTGFLDGWYPYELTMVGLPGIPSAERLDEIALAVGAARHDRPVLPTLAGCRLWYSGHDDCYVWVESTDRRVPLAIFGRLLTLLAGSALVADAEPVDVSDPSDALVEALVAESQQWVGALGVVSPTAVVVNLSATPQPWRLAHPPPGRVDHTAVYDIAEATWHLAEPARAAVHQPVN
ncbi:hypothetical protein ACFOOK_01005 [Micromonospora krabiensis]|uniref:Uncharacterized protein n=1 Tax=Micromonospora krabiensis TaxID=307121 RepID=A0A1C3MXH6_9ACTN|nr:hypothetical protein [Micromonospora krabiensis]SBV25040.1 hypothetical protein GA0070620_0508 [Micromonospora krabiensis]